MLVLLAIHRELAHPRGFGDATIGAVSFRAPDDPIAISSTYFNDKALCRLTGLIVARAEVC